MKHEVCPECDGSGLIYEEGDDEPKTCPTCGGDRFIVIEDDD